YWRMNYRFDGKQKTLSLGVYPSVTLAKSRERRDRARALLADGVDPSAAKVEEKAARRTQDVSTFELVARRWLAKTAATRAESTQAKNTAWLDQNVFPFI